MNVKPVVSKIHIDATTMETLGALGYIIDSKHKLPFRKYAETEMSPVFKDGTLTGLVLNDEFLDLSVSGEVPFDDVPTECVKDVLELLARFAPHARISRPEVYIVTAVCSLCKQDSPSFMTVGEVHTCIACMDL